MNASHKRQDVRRIHASLVVVLACLVASAQQAQAGDTNVEAAVASERRLPADIARDAHRRPGSILSFFEVSKGDTVMEIGAGSGYYTELLSTVVGDDGYVLAQNPFFFLDFIAEDITARYARRDFANVNLVFGGVKKLQIENGRLDAVFFINIYHDIFYSEASGEAISPVASSLLHEIHRMLKPGGVVGVIDHLADPGSTRSAAAELHRIAASTLEADFQSAGFELVGTLDILRNTQDDHTKAWFQDPDLKDHTDRTVLKFRKAD